MEKQPVFASKVFALKSDFEEYKKIYKSGILKLGSRQGT